MLDAGIGDEKVIETILDAVDILEKKAGGATP